MADLRSQAAAQGTRWTSVQHGDVTVVDGVTVLVKHPGPADWDRQKVRNDDSVVVELRWKDTSFVFAGDIGDETESAIARSFEPSRLRVVKVPHHGSSSSSSDGFVRALKPDVAVVSVGRSNNFGHPSPAVLARYQAVGAIVLRTDRDGAVTIDTDGTSLDVRTFNGGTFRLSKPKQRPPPR
jgi:competence protein ComEC